MISRILGLCFVFLGSIAQAEIKWIGTLGVESRMVRDQDQNLVGRSYNSYALGFSWDDLMFQIEYARFSEITGNSTALKVDRKIEDFFLWSSLVSDWSWVLPYASIGLGVENENVDTTLLGQSTRDHGRPNYLMGGALGFRAPIQILWLSVEARVLFSDHSDPNPTVSALARIGFIF